MKKSNKILVGILISVIMIGDMILMCSTNSANLFLLGILLDIIGTIVLLTIFVFLPYLVTTEKQRKEALAQENRRWNVKKPLFYFPASGNQVLKSTRLYFDDEAIDVLWVNKHWRKFDPSLCLYHKVWINDNPKYRRVQKDKYIGYVDETGFPFISVKFTSATPYIDGKAQVKTIEGVEYVIDEKGNRID